jgi:pimeloyl-ACP methyl ester carboxylesterase
MQEITALLGRHNANGRDSATVQSRMLQCHLALPTQDATNFTLYPFPEISRGLRIIPLAHIRVDCVTSPIALPLFKVTDAVEAGITRFTYLGNNPLYTVVQGAISYFLRLGTDPRARVTSILNLAPVLNVPSFEAGGQSGGSRFLGASLGNLDPDPQILLPTGLEPGCTLTAEQKAKILDGLWVRKQIMVTRDIVFYPDTTYELQLFTQVLAGDVGLTDYGLRIESGGFSFSYDPSAVFERIRRSAFGWRNGLGKAWDNALTRSKHIVRPPRPQKATEVAFAEFDGIPLSPHYTMLPPLSAADFHYSARIHYRTNEAGVPIKAPCLIHHHGSAATSHMDGASPEILALLSLGFNIISFRGFGAGTSSTDPANGYGNVHAPLLYGNALRSAYRVQSSIEFAEAQRDRYFTDDRICLFGNSAGATAALAWSGHSARFKSQDKISAIFGNGAVSAGMGDKSWNDVSRVINMMTGLIENVIHPTLLSYGDRDAYAPPEMSRAFQTAAKFSGAPVSFYFPGDYPHNWLADNAAVWTPVVGRFFAAHMT